MNQIFWTHLNAIEKQILHVESQQILGCEEGSILWYHNDRQSQTMEDERRERVDEDQGPWQGVAVDFFVVKKKRCIPLDGSEGCLVSGCVEPVSW